MDEGKRSTLNKPSKQGSSPVHSFLPSPPATQLFSLLSQKQQGHQGGAGGAWSFSHGRWQRPEVQDGEGEERREEQGLQRHVYPHPSLPRSPLLPSSPHHPIPIWSDSVQFRLCVCLQAAGDQQEGHEHPGAYPVVIVLLSLFPDPVKEPPRARSGRWRPVTPISGGGGGRGSPSYVGSIGSGVRTWIRADPHDGDDLGPAALGFPWRRRQQPGWARRAPKWARWACPRFFFVFLKSLTATGNIRCRCG